MDELPMQCAWCRREYRDRGRIGVPLPILLPEASHGLCHVCADAVLRAERDRRAISDEEARSLRVERLRFCRFAREAGRRAALRARRSDALVAASDRQVASSRALLDRDKASV